MSARATTAGIVLSALLAATSPASAQARDSARALLERARQQAGDGQGAAALETLRRARALAPNAEEVLNAYARAALGARAPGDALEVLEALARMCPTVVDYPYLLGVALFQIGELGRAVEALRAAEALDPNRPLTLIALGLALNNQKLYDEAKSVLVRALELQADSLEAAAALAEAHEGLDELEPAEALARRVVAGEPNAAARATARLVLGMVLMKRGRFADARDALLEAVAADTTKQKAHYQLSLVYARLGDEGASRKHLEIYRHARQEAERMKQLQRR